MRVDTSDNRPAATPLRRAFSRSLSIFLLTRQYAEDLLLAQSG
jgi:hypothetical protein